MIESDIAILGAGPAGTTAALFLSKSGISSVLIDRAEFPRDKICGDCLGGYVVSVLRQLGEDVLDRFIALHDKTEGKGVHFYSPDLVKLSIPANQLVDGKIREVALCKRIDFDNFLFNEAKQKKDISIHCGIDIFSFLKEKGHLVFFNKKEEAVLKTKLAIIATGSQSKVAMDLSGYKSPKKFLAGGIRCYYENVKSEGEEGYIEFHFLREILPGYLWIFPLNKTTANVGMGQRSDVISKNKVNLRNLLPELINSYPHLRERFADAKLISPPVGFPLSLGSRKRKISGDNYLLTGDAASLIEPFFGEGIGNAMYSGKFAAEQAVACIMKNDFSTSFNKNYDDRIYKKIGNALKLSRLLQQAAFHPGLVNRVFNNIENKKSLQNMLSRVINGDIARDPFMGVQFLVRSITGL